MKKTRNILAIVLCLVLALSMATTVFASPVATNEHNHTITINSKEGYVYEAYQIFYGDLDEKGTLSNIEWGRAVKDKGTELLAALKAANDAYKDCNDAEDVAVVLGKSGGFDNATAMAFADIVATLNADEEKADEKDTYKFLDETTAFEETAQHTIPVEGDGYYLIINTTIPDGDDTVYSRHMLEVVRDVSVSHKGTFPTVDKKIIEDGKKVNINEASIGDVVTYELNGTLPNNLDDYDTYYYAFHDTLSKGLTYNGDAKVYINGVDVTAYFYINAVVNEETKETVITIGVPDILALELVEDIDPNTDGNQTVGNIKGGLLDTDSRVIVNYTATLNENAVIAVAGNPNVVDLEYSNNPNQDGDGAQNPPPPPPGPELPEPNVPTGETPEKKVETWTTELTIYKVDGAGTPLKGAEFQLTGENLNVSLTTGTHFVRDEENGTYYKLLNNTYTQVAPTEDDPATEDANEDNTAAYVQPYEKYRLETFLIQEAKGDDPVEVKAFVDETTGILTFTGLGTGEYTLTETVTPAGFNTIDPITFTVTFNYETKMFRTNNNAINVGQNSGDDHYNALYTTVVNEAGSTLPSTGGMGTTLFYIFGGTMVLAAVVLLVTKKRMLTAE